MSDQHSSNDNINQSTASNIFISSLSNKYDFLALKEKCWQKWQQQNIYAFKEEFKEDGKNIFSIDTPPPTISGALHIGHIFSYCHIDFIARKKRMDGRNVFFPCGFDNNGLPTERLVEKLYKIKAHQTPKNEFLALCQKTSDEKIQQFKNLFNDIGFSFDWNLQYETNDQRCRLISQKSFLQLYKKGLIYKKLKPVFWDTKDQTAIACAEVEEKEFESCMNYIDFYTENGKRLTIATTRPELLCACVAVLFNPQDHRYQDLKGQKLIVPIFGNNVPAIPDTDVLQEKGTGLVMCCTFGDEMDIIWWERHKLPLVKAIDKYGRLSAFFGKKVEDARQAAIEQLSAKSLLVKQEKIIHNVKCAERSGAKLEIVPTWQWYIKVLPYKDQALQNAKKIRWLPKKMLVKIEQWIEGIKWDWCISRQRYLGVPIPVWYDRNTKNILLPEEDELPIDPINSKPKDVLTDELEPEKDVLDTWATSSLTPQINSAKMQNNDFCQMDLRPQAHEIIRTWAFYTILRTLLSDNAVPWKNIMISGWCLAHDKTKMSKSKGNAVDPVALIQRYGADIVRYWAAHTKTGNDTCYSENIFAMGKKLVNKIWNASRFVERFIIQDFDVKKITYATDIWIFNQLCELILKVNNAFEEFDYCTAKSLTEKFFLQEYCDTYLELVKARAYGQEPQKQSAMHALSASLCTLLKLFAPFLPYITEEIYDSIFLAQKSIHQKGSWPKFKKIDVKNQVTTCDMLYILSRVREFKAERHLALNSKIQCLTIKTNNKILKDAEYDIKSACTASKIEWIFTDMQETVVEILN